MTFSAAPKSISSSDAIAAPAPVERSQESLRAYTHLANLQLTPRLTSALLEAYDNTPAAIFDATDSALDNVPGVTSRQLARLRDPVNVPTDRQIEWMERHGVWLALQHESGYPAALREIPDPPAILFVRGTLIDSDTSGLGIVGSRHATPYGRTVAERLARELANHGVAIISGGAVGIDAAAHRGAVDGGGRTIAFLGCGLDVDYPRENRALFERIISGGALVSEAPPGAQPEAWRFPQRNRLISGASMGVLVVEAPQASGALITARFAAEHGRTVMAVPGNIDRPSSVGTNSLIRDGAVPITRVQDILEELRIVSLAPAQPALDLGDTARTNPSAPRTTHLKPAAPVLGENLPESQRKLFALLTNVPQHIDALAQELGMSAMQASVEATLLELASVAKRLPGNTYVRFTA